MIVEYEEPRNEHGPHWRMHIDRSASGEPTVLITISSEWANGTHHDENTIVVENAPKVLAPLIQWLREKEAEDGRE